MTNKLFLRRNTGEYSRLGNKRKKLHKWRSPKGRDNKMRLRRKGYPKTVEIGYKQEVKTRGMVDEKEVHKVQNIEELKKLHRGSVVELGRVGAKTKLEMAKIVKEKELKVVNFSFGLFNKAQKQKVEKITKKKESKIIFSKDKKIRQNGKETEPKTDSNKKDVKKSKEEKK